MKGELEQLRQIAEGEASLGNKQNADPAREQMQQLDTILSLLRMIEERSRLGTAPSQRHQHTEEGIDSHVLNEEIIKLQGDGSSSENGKRNSLLANPIGPLKRSSLKGATRCSPTHRCSLLASPVAPFKRNSLLGAKKDASPGGTLGSLDRSIRTRISCSTTCDHADQLDSESNGGGKPKGTHFQVAPGPSDPVAKHGAEPPTLDTVHPAIGSNPNSSALDHLQVISVLNSNNAPSPTLPRGIIDPKSTQKCYWDALVCVSLLFLAFSSPISMGFIREQAGWHLTCDLLVDVVSFADIAASFRTAYVDERAFMNTRISEIRGRQLRTWFLPDFVSALPLQLIPQLAARADRNSARGLRLLYLIKLGRLTRLLRLTQLPWARKLMPALGMLIVLIIAYLILLNLLVSLYWFVAASYLPDGAVGSYWPLDPEAVSAEFSDRYARAFFTTILMVMAGDTAPKTAGQHVFSGVVMIIGTCMDSVIVGSLVMLIWSMVKKKADHQEHISHIRYNLAYHKISSALSERIISFVEYLYTCGYYNEDGLDASLPQSLALALDLQKKHHLISSVEMFLNIKPATLVAIVRALKQVIFADREYVMVQGSVGTSMFFINRGIVQITRVEVKARGQLLEMPVSQLQDGAHFGEMALMGDKYSRRTASALALTHCDMQKLHREEFDAICTAHDDLRQELEEVTEERRDGSGGGRSIIGSPFRKSTHHSRKTIIGGDRTSCNDRTNAKSIGSTWCRMLGEARNMDTADEKLATGDRSLRCFLKRAMVHSKTESEGNAEKEVFRQAMAQVERPNPGDVGRETEGGFLTGNHQQVSRSLGL